MDSIRTMDSGLEDAPPDPRSLSLQELTRQTFVSPGQTSFWRESPYGQGLLRRLAELGNDADTVFDVESLRNVLEFVQSKEIFPSVPQWLSARLLAYFNTPNRNSSSSSNDGDQVSIEAALAKLIAWRGADSVSVDVQNAAGNAFVARIDTLQTLDDLTKVASSQASLTDPIQATAAWWDLVMALDRLPAIADRSQDVLYRRSVAAYGGAVERLHQDWLKQAKALQAQIDTAEKPLLQQIEQWRSELDRLNQIEVFALPPSGLSAGDDRTIGLSYAEQAKRQRDERADLYQAIFASIEAAQADLAANTDTDASSKSDQDAAATDMTSQGETSTAPNGSGAPQQNDSTQMWIALVIAAVLVLALIAMVVTTVLSARQRSKREATASAQPESLSVQ